MAFDNYLKERIDAILLSKGIHFLSKRMMGGLCYMVNDKMLCGLVKDQLMARIGVELYENALTRDHVNEMNFTGRALKGYVFIDEEGIDMEEDLEYWIQLCLDFNPHARSSKKS